MMNNALDINSQLIKACEQFVYDPLGFVLWAYPWGEGVLKGYDGPDKWQADFLIEYGKALESGQPVRMAYKSGHGIGKFLSNSTIYDTPKGQKRWGDNKVGDQVFGLDGNPVTITDIYPQGIKPIYRMTFDDGSSVLCGLDHQWAVRGRKHRRRDLPGWEVITTEEILERGVKRSNGVALARQWEIPKQGPVKFEEREVDLHPYFMGVWLGDGTKDTPCYTKPYTEVASHLKDVGYEISESKDGKTKRVLNISHIIKQDPVFQLNSYERYIPEDYKYNTIENRAELLRGLLDTDGECGKGGSITYSSTSYQLICDVVWLARSLGGKAQIQPTVKQGWYKDDNGAEVECRECWRCTVTMPVGFRPFYIKHKAERVLNTIEDRYLIRWIDSIEYSHDEEASCITVDAKDSLYLANDFIATHNTALIAWLVQHFMSTRPYPEVIVTANTAIQLETKTWRELAKWNNLLINKHWFSWSATRYKSNMDPSTWFAVAQPWSKERPDAFQGSHEQHILFLFDEASAIADVIWDTTEGAMTTPGAAWVVFGNPTLNTGRFRECWSRFRHRWITGKVDSRESRFTDKKQINQWIEDYGEDSDFVRVRVKGEFPRASSNQLIDSDRVYAAAGRKLQPHLYNYMPTVIGVDVARYGNNESVIIARQGHHVHEIQGYREKSTMDLVGYVTQAIERYDPQAIFVDVIGIGAGVVDRLRQLGYSQVIEVVSGAKAINEDMYYNLRAEMWCKMRDWLEYGSIPDHEGLKSDLTGIEYGFDSKNRIQLEKKEDMEKRGLASPDYADSLAFTFAMPVNPLSGPNHKVRVETEFTV